MHKSLTFVMFFMAMSVAAYAQKNILIGNTVIGDTNEWMFPMLFKFAITPAQKILAFEKRMEGNLQILEF